MESNDNDGVMKMFGLTKLAQEFNISDDQKRIAKIYHQTPQDAFNKHLFDRKMNLLNTGAEYVGAQKKHEQKGANTGSLIGGLGAGLAAGGAGLLLRKKPNSELGKAPGQAALGFGLIGGLGGAVTGFNINKRNFDEKHPEYNERIHQAKALVDDSELAMKRKRTADYLYSEKGPLYNQ